MVLGSDYIILSSIIIAFLLPFYIFRKKIFKHHFEKNNITYFVHELNIYLNNKYPKIYFDFTRINSIVKSTPYDLATILIIEEMTKQFINHEYIKKTQKNIPKDLIWGSYEKESIPKNSTPNNLLRRKNFVLKRDNYKCNRCGKAVKLDTSMLLLIKDIEQGGTYHFENLSILCNDCNKINHAQEAERLMKDLNIYHSMIRRFIK
jgi:5-methylcytosine-specific restriction endonuclease McrA